LPIGYDALYSFIVATFTCHFSDIELFGRKA
jgi:hypothetical protein